MILAHKSGENTSEAKLMLENVLSQNQLIEAKKRARTFVKSKSPTLFASDTIKGFYLGIKTFVESKTTKDKARHLCEYTSTSHRKLQPNLLS